MTQPPWEPQLDVFGGFLRQQRHQANLSLRELAALTQLSNAYLSQLERGHHEPSVRVLRSLAFCGPNTDPPEVIRRGGD